MSKKQLGVLLAALRQNERQAQAQLTYIRGRFVEMQEALERDERQAYAKLGFIQGRIAQVEELLAPRRTRGMPGTRETPREEPCEE